MTIQKDTTEQLMVLRAVTRSTGMLHEAQILQLKHWPLFLMEGVKYVLNVNQETKELAYDMTRKKKTPKDLYVELEKATQWLLGSEWKLTIAMNGKRVFTGTRKIHEIDKAEKAAYDPFIKCVKQYVGQDTPFADPPTDWKKK